MKSLGKPPMGGNQIAVFVVWGFLIGIFAVWLYAAIRPRYGAGPKTALCAGSAVWGVGYLMPAVGPLMMELFPTWMMAIGLGVGIVEILAATLLGARLYQEAGTA